MADQTVTEFVAQKLRELPLEEGEVLVRFSYDGQDYPQAHRVLGSMASGFAFRIAPGVQLLEAVTLRTTRNGAGFRETKWKLLSGRWEAVAVTGDV